MNLKNNILKYKIVDLRKVKLKIGLQFELLKIA